MFGAGDPVWVQIGTRTVNDITADFVQADSTVNYRWFIQEVGVEAAGS